MALLVWISIYPLITLVFYYFGDNLQLLPLYLRTLAITLFVVPVMVFILLPFWTIVFRKIFRNW
jgi:antibiotic biosynthesis monooxygenase (ABM) superfamily enzyme